MSTDTNDDDNHLKEYSLAETKRHKPCLIYRGHRYVQDKIQNRTIYWRCEDRSHCNGRAHQLIGNESLPILTIKHNHPPIVDDLTRHDIVSVDSHRRRRRQNRKLSSNHSSNEQNDFVLLSNMTSSIKLENNQNKHQCFQQQQQQTAMVKNLHLSEVITTTTPSHMHYSNNVNLPHHSTVDPIEMTKLLSSITRAATITTNHSSKKPLGSSSLDYSSRLNHFSWEEIEGRYLPVIFRNENGMSQRYTSKMFVENILFQTESWQKHAVLARSLPPLVSYSYTEHELKLFRIIIAWHLASFYFKTIPSTDCLIRFEDLLDFYNTLRKLRDSPSTTSFNRPIAPLPPPHFAPPPPPPPSLISKSNIQSQSSFELPTQILSSIKQQQRSEISPKDSGWVQINNVFVPYIIKIKIRDNELNKYHTRQPVSQIQREFYVPYEILIKCNIFSDIEFAFKKFLIKATQDDFDLLNNLITNINIFDEKVPEKTLLVNLYHVMVGLNRILYIKFLPTKQPRTQVNKYHADVLTHKGGTLLMNGNKLIPYIVQNNRFYVPLLYTFHSLPNILLQAKRGARAPRQYEIDYLNLLFIYFSIDTPPLTSDTLLVDIFNIKCSNLQTPIHFRTLHEHQQHEKNKLLNAVVRPTQTPKSSNSSTTTTAITKTNKCPPTNVVVNPMIHHPSFYGLTPSKPIVSPIKQPEIRTINFNNQSLNAIVKSSDQSINDWKISIKEIFEKFSFNIDYEKFIQWCQTNLLLPLIKLDEDEIKILKINYDNDNYYVYQQHLDRCIALLNDLKRGSISMTLLPPSNNDTQQLTVKSPLAGAKKRKPTVPTTRHILPTSTDNEANSSTNLSTTTPPHDIELPPTPEESNISISDDNPVETSNEQVICPIVADNDDGDDDMMPVVASVEESIQSEIDPTFVVESSDCNDERIRLDDTIPSCSSGYESSAVNNNIDNMTQGENNKNDDENNSRENSSSCLPIKPSNSSKKVNKKRQRNRYGKSRARSLTPRKVKKQCPIDNNNDNDDSSLTVIITSDKIEQHLRTLFMVMNDSRRTRTRPVKTPTRLVEEINTNSSIKITEPDSNVFDILSSPTTTDTMNNNNNNNNDDEQTDNSQNSCTYNVVITSKPNKLGLTIKKVVQT